MVDEVLFDNPGSTSAVKWVEQQGRLVLIWARESIPDFPRNDGPGEVIRADVVVLDPPNSAPILYENTIIFPKKMLGQVRNNIGKGRPNLGRVGQEAAKPGQNPAWILMDPEENDKRMAMAYLQNPNAMAAGQTAPQGQSASQMPPAGQGWNNAPPQGQQQYAQPGQQSFAQPQPAAPPF